MSQKYNKDMKALAALIAVALYPFALGQHYSARGPKVIQFTLGWVLMGASIAMPAIFSMTLAVHCHETGRKRRCGANLALDTGKAIGAAVEALSQGGQRAKIAAELAEAQLVNFYRNVRNGAAHTFDQTCHHLRSRLPHVANQESLASLAVITAFGAVASSMGWLTVSDRINLVLLGAAATFLLDYLKQEGIKATPSSQRSTLADISRGFTVTNRRLSKAEDHALAVVTEGLSKALPQVIRHVQRLG